MSADRHIAYRVTVEPDPLGGGYVAECLDLPGCVSDGDTEEEARANLDDAIAEVLAVRLAVGRGGTGPKLPAP